MRCVSHSALCAHLDALLARSATWAKPLDYGPSSVARLIRDEAAAGNSKAALRIYDEVTQNNGLEGLSYGGKDWIYSNTGEPYRTTLILCPGGSLILGNWGDIAERYPDMSTFTPR